MKKPINPLDWEAGVEVLASNDPAASVLSRVKGAAFKTKG